jgi:hypothetical protein
MARLDAMLLAIATRVRTVHEHTAYPNPRSISGTHVTIVVASGIGTLTKQDEQEWLEQPMLKVFAGTPDAPTAYSAIDRIPDAVADLFSPTNMDAYTLGGLVDFCQMSGYEFDQILGYAGESFWGGIIRLAVKRRRFAGSS